MGGLETKQRKADEEMNVLWNKPDALFKFVKFMRKDMHGGGCKKDKDGRLLINEKDRRKL